MGISRAPQQSSNVHPFADENYGSKQSGRQRARDGQRTALRFHVGTNSIIDAPECQPAFSAHSITLAMFALPSKANISRLACDVRHVWTAPSWQELSSPKQHWSVQPCVRPLDAVHMTAGHNALRGSGPCHKLAFDHAMARVGCPDRRIDRLCVTCCSPPNLHITPDARRDLVTPQARRVPCNARPWPSWPMPCVRVCLRARWRRLWPVAAPARR